MRVSDGSIGWISEKGSIYDVPGWGSLAWLADIGRLPTAPWLLPGIAAEGIETVTEQAGLNLPAIPSTVEDIKAVGSIAVVGLIAVAAILFLRGRK
jgi:hypothetical protein